jgi:WS/DGAT/MGAT family acyltransferase
MRRELLAALRTQPALQAVEADFQHLLASWFSPAFLALKRVDWHSPAHLLEQIIQHEAVHQIRDWQDLRRRLAPDRRCFAFFHPALPDEPLIASVPVAMKTQEAGREGNAITFVLCNLGTDLDNPHERLEVITESMRATKELMANRPGLQLTALGLLTALGPSVLTRIPGSASAPPPYNVVISNVPGPRERLYWNGAEVEGIYPLSIPTENQALNITCLSYANNLEFGIVGCRQAVPRLQRLLDYLEETLQEYE